MNAKPNSVREVIVKLLEGDWDLDKPLLVRVVRRDEQGTVTEASEVPTWWINWEGRVVVEAKDVDANRKGVPW